MGVQHGTKVLGIYSKSTVDLTVKMCGKSTAFEAYGVLHKTVSKAFSIYGWSATKIGCHLWDGETMGLHDMTFALENFTSEMVWLNKFLSEHFVVVWGLFVLLVIFRMLWAWGRGIMRGVGTSRCRFGAGLDLNQGVQWRFPMSSWTVEGAWVVPPALWREDHHTRYVGSSNNQEKLRCSEQHWSKIGNMKRFLRSSFIPLKMTHKVRPSRGTSKRKAC